MKDLDWCSHFSWHHQKAEKYSQNSHFWLWQPHCVIIFFHESHQRITRPARTENQETRVPRTTSMRDLTFCLSRNACTNIRKGVTYSIFIALQKGINSSAFARSQQQPINFLKSTWNCWSNKFRSDFGYLLIFSGVYMKLELKIPKVIKKSIFKSPWAYVFLKTDTAWKVSKYGVFSGPYFPVFSPNTGKYGSERTPYLDHFHAVWTLLERKLCTLSCSKCLIQAQSVWFKKMLVTPDCSE